MFWRKRKKLTEMSVHGGVVTGEAYWVYVCSTCGSVVVSNAKPDAFDSLLDSWSCECGIKRWHSCIVNVDKWKSIGFNEKCQGCRYQFICGSSRAKFKPDEGHVFNILSGYTRLLR